MIALLPERAVLLSAGGFELRWYGVLYVLGFVVAWWLLPRLQKHRGLTLSGDDWLQVITWSALGVVLGGRLGYVLFYEPIYYAQHPLQALALWQGGMASHGGFIGVAIALWLVAKRLKINVLALADVLIVPVAVGLMLGRLGNWINGELYISNAWHAAAVGKNALIAVVTYVVLKATTPSPPQAGPPLLRKEGKVLAIFLVIYGVLRFVTEYGRVQPWALQFGLTRGQLLTLPILVAGVLLWIWLRESKSKK